MVQSSSLDATSKAALAAALASLYQRTTSVEGRQNPDDAPPAASATGSRRRGAALRAGRGPGGEPTGCSMNSSHRIRASLSSMRRKPRPPSRCRCPRFRPFPDSEGWAVPRRRACQRVESDCPPAALPMPGPMLDPATLGASLAEPGEPPARSDMPDDSQPDGPQPDGPQPDDSQADDTQKGADKADAHAGDEGTEQVPAARPSYFRPVR